MKGVSDEQVLEHFKEAFPPQIDAQLLEIDDVDIVISKARILIQLQALLW